jgi:hypothetical protein
MVLYEVEAGAAVYETCIIQTYCVSPPPSPPPPHLNLPAFIPENSIRSFFPHGFPLFPLHPINLFHRRTSSYTSRRVYVCHLCFLLFFQTILHHLSPYPIIFFPYTSRKVCVCHMRFLLFSPMVSSYTSRRVNVCHLFFLLFFLARIQIEGYAFFICVFFLFFQTKLQ